MADLGAMARTTAWEEEGLESEIDAGWRTALHPILYERVRAPVIGGAECQNSGLAPILRGCRGSKAVRSKAVRSPCRRGSSADGPTISARAVWRPVQVPAPRTIMCAPTSPKRGDEYAIIASLTCAAYGAFLSERSKRFQTAPRATRTLALCAAAAYRWLSVRSRSGGCGSDRRSRSGAFGVRGCRRNPSSPLYPFWHLSPAARISISAGPATAH